MAGAWPWHRTVALLERVQCPTLFISTPAPPPPRVPGRRGNPRAAQGRAGQVLRRGHQPQEEAAEEAGGWAGGCVWVAGGWRARRACSAMLWCPQRSGQGRAGAATVPNIPRQTSPAATRASPQAAGKKRMKSLGKVDVPQEVGGPASRLVSPSCAPIPACDSWHRAAPACWALLPGGLPPVNCLATPLPAPALPPCRPSWRCCKSTATRRAWTSDGGQQAPAPPAAARAPFGARPRSHSAHAAAPPPCTPTSYFSPHTCISAILLPPAPPSSTFLHYPPVAQFNFRSYTPFQVSCATRWPATPATGCWKPLNVTGNQEAGEQGVHVTATGSTWAL